MERNAGIQPFWYSKAMPSLAITEKLPTDFDRQINPRFLSFQRGALSSHPALGHQSWNAKCLCDTVYAQAVPISQHS